MFEPYSRYEVMDLIISVLREYEKRLDELVYRLEQIVSKLEVEK